MKEELYKKIYIKSEADLPKSGLYFCGITDSCFGSFHFNPDDKDDIDFWIGNVMWYLQPIEPVEAEKDKVTDDDIEKYFTSHHYDNKNGHHYRVKKDRIFGAKAMRDGLIKKGE